MYKATYPCSLVNFPLLWQFLSDPVCVPECPHCQLVQDTKLQEDIEIIESVWHLVFSKGIGQMGGFGSILAPRVFVKVVEPATSTKIPISLINPSIHSFIEFLSGIRTYVRPRCDEIHFRRHRPISRSFSEGVGLRHSFSRSYHS